jgi:hypothetical protein
MMITGHSSCVLANTPGRWPLLPSSKETGSVSCRDVLPPKTSSPHSADLELPLSLLPSTQEMAKKIHAEGKSHGKDFFRPWDQNIEEGGCWVFRIPWHLEENNFLKIFSCLILFQSNTICFVKLKYYRTILGRMRELPCILLEVRSSPWLGSPPFPILPALLLPPVPTKIWFSFAPGMQILSSCY